MSDKKSVSSVDENAISFISKGEFEKIMSSLKSGQPQVQHVSPAILLGVSDSEFIKAFKYGIPGFEFDQPVGNKTFDLIEERCKKLGLDLSKNKF